MCGGFTKIQDGKSLHSKSLNRLQWRHIPSGNPEQPAQLFIVAEFLQTLVRRSAISMPPKKDGKQNADKTATLAEKSAPDDALPEGGKEFYRAQIRDLEERLEKWAELNLDNFSWR